MANKLAKSTNFRCRFKEVVFFRHLLSRTDYSVAHERVKPFFACGNRICRCSGGRFRLRLCEQSNGSNCYSGKQKTQFRVQKTPPVKCCHISNGFQYRESARRKSMQ
jgi:hypothetical protein